jgi:60 kDa SS-A/Ro ribonucleoprotein
MTDPLTRISTRSTPQNQPDLAVAERQKRNAAGGYVFRASDETRIRRFLTLGTVGGTYYTGERELTKANAEVVLACARDRGAWLAEQARQVSVAGRAPRQNPAIFALAAVAGLGDEAARALALSFLPDVCRTGTTLFAFNRYVEQFRGRGPALNRAVAAWYLAEPPVIEEGQEPTEEQARLIEIGKTVDELAYQVVKYRQRDGWSHRDLLRLVRPKTADPARNALFKWITSGELDVRESGPLPGLVTAFTHAQTLTGSALTDLIGMYPLSWEMLPDAARTPEVWRALIRKGMPIGALLRQLPTLTRLGVLDDPEILGTVRGQLEDPERLKRGRIHPVNVLLAMRTYASGRSLRGSSTWEPKARLVDSLDAAFYAAYGAVVPAGKRTLIALDVSGSMGSAISGMPLSAREAAAALSLVTLATEPSCDIVGFTSSAAPRRGYSSWGMSRGSALPITELTISPRQRLDDVVRYTGALDFGGTDTSLPFRWALEKGRTYDTVITFTDNETWAGPVHTQQALARYRERTGLPVRSIVAGMTATDASIADPNDPLSLDVAGFDSAVPNLIADFSRGEV